MRFQPIQTALLFLLSAASFLHGQPVRLTLEEAEVMALKNHPAIGAVEFGAYALRERVEQTAAARRPIVSANVTGAGAPDGSRLAAGALNNPIIYSRFASGLSVSQLVLDFGRTGHLVDSSRHESNAEFERVKATRADVLLNVQRTYISALRARTLVEIAKSTVAARQIVVDQVTAMVNAQLKSGLDLSFASTNLAEAKLLLAAAGNESLAAQATLAEALGYAGTQEFQLVETPMPPVEPLVLGELTARALRERPELASARLEMQAAESIAAAEKASKYPSVSVVANLGVVPTHVDGIRNNYAAAGINLNLPMLNGGLFKARRQEAEFRIKAADRRTGQLANSIAREVAVALLDVNTAEERISLSQQLIDQATRALELAQARYDLGLSSIVELSQAQLVKTNAEIQSASARYDYQIRRAVLNHRVGLLR